MWIVKKNGSSNANQADKLKLGVMISKLHTAMANAKGPQANLSKTNNDMKTR